MKWKEELKNGKRGLGGINSINGSGGGGGISCTPLGALVPGRPQSAASACNLSHSSNSGGSTNSAIPSPSTPFYPFLPSCCQLRIGVPRTFLHADTHFLPSTHWTITHWLPTTTSTRHWLFSSSQLADTRRRTQTHQTATCTALTHTRDTSSVCSVFECVCFKVDSYTAIVIYFLLPWQCLSFSLLAPPSKQLTGKV